MQGSMTAPTRPSDDMTVRVPLPTHDISMYMVPAGMIVGNTLEPKPSVTGRRISAESGASSATGSLARGSSVARGAAVALADAVRGLVVVPLLHPDSRTPVATSSDAHPQRITASRVESSP